jgi:hypothetical protein
LIDPATICPSDRSELVVPASCRREDAAAKTITQMSLRVKAWSSRTGTSNDATAGN